MSFLNPLKPASLGLALALLLSGAAAAQPERRGPWGEPGSTLAMAQRMDAASFARLQDAGAQVEETEDRRSFVVWQAPQGFDPKTGIVLVTLHGHQGWASKGVMVWNDEVRARGWAHLAVQWWYGRSAEAHGYARPADIYPWTVEALRRHGVEPGRVIFEGFSMGSANCYAMTYLDRQAARPYFAVTIANSGALADDFPPNRPFLSGEGGARPFAGTHWIFYCSERDEEQRDACNRIARGADRIKQLGGDIALFIRDPQGPHGGFKSNADFPRAMDLAATFVTGR